MFCFLSSTYSSQKNRWFFGNNTGTSIVSLIVDYYGSYSCIVNRRDGRLSAGKDRVTENYRCLAGGIGGVVITEIYCAVIVHIKGMASSGCLKTFFLVTVSLSASFLHCWQVW